jgi:hypothetical protein
MHVHEQSETIQGKNGRWKNVFGYGLPNAGEQLPGTGEYDTLEDAVQAARERSKSFDRPTKSVMGETLADIHGTLPAEVKAFLKSISDASAQAILENMRSMVPDERLAYGRTLVKP